MTGSGLGFPDHEIVAHWALLAGAIFDETVYLVGSAAISPTYRDVDLRVVMSDEKFDAWFGSSLATMRMHGTKWSALCTAISVWGQRVTGLPIDFQVQRRSNVSEVDREKAVIPIMHHVVAGDFPIYAPSRAPVSKKSAVNGVVCSKHGIPLVEGRSDDDWECPDCEDEFEAEIARRQSQTENSEGTK